eukprot:CAMPEP_0198291674 /NCGR_PEP_ID=MMETSP1449-20131203/9129_1 /TAXON_ID=420275 /ORGANISM="Attheya septentrionalis, Strain CCMP2084" /LENGTH=344 /DNA_ID=CAMNT_0043990345 /DNA_START=256 /DNA_END=1287 /DNA_ORIENTATION=+
MGTCHQPAGSSGGITTNEPAKPQDRSASKMKLPGAPTDHKQMPVVLPSEHAHKTGSDAAADTEEVILDLVARGVTLYSSDDFSQAATCFREALRRSDPDAPSIQTSHASSHSTLHHASLGRDEDHDDTTNRSLDLLHAACLSHMVGGEDPSSSRAHENILTSLDWRMVEEDDDVDMTPPPVEQDVQACKNDAQDEGDASSSSRSTPPITSYIYQRMDFDEGMHAFSDVERLDKPAGLLMGCGTLLDDHSLKAILYFNLGQAKRRMQHFDQAARCYSLAWKSLLSEKSSMATTSAVALKPGPLHPLIVPILHNAGQLQYRRGKIEEAIVTYTEALAQARALYGHF